jgi:hypothetical protein
MLSAGAVVGLAGETGVPVPNLAGGPGYGTVLALLAPAPTVAILAGGLAGRRLPGELAAARLVRLLDLVWVVIGVAWFALAATATDLAGTRDAAVRNLAGLMLLGSVPAVRFGCRSHHGIRAGRHDAWSGTRPGVVGLVPPSCSGSNCSLDRRGRSGGWFDRLDRPAEDTPP